jgi:hypothetical protein
LEFKSATFDDKKDNIQRFIVTSIGKYLITWNLRDVLKGNIRNYTVKIAIFLIIW